MLTTLINISWPVAWFGKFSNHLNVFNVWSETTRIFQYQYHKSIPDDDFKHLHTHIYIYTYINSKFPYINDTSLKDILIYKQRQLQKHSFQCRMFAFYTNTYVFILVYIYLLCVKFIYILVYICVNLCLCLWPSLYMVLMNISCFGTFVRI